MKKSTVLLFAVQAVLFAIISILLTAYSIGKGAPYFIEALFIGIASLLFFGISIILKSQIDIINSVLGLYYYIKEEVIGKEFGVSNMMGPVSGASITYTEDELEEKLKTMDDNHPIKNFLKDIYKEIQKKKSEMPIKDLSTKDLDKLIIKAIEFEDYKKAEEIRKEIINRKNNT